MNFIKSEILSITNNSLECTLLSDTKITIKKEIKNNLNVGDKITFRF